MTERGITTAATSRVTGGFGIAGSPVLPWRQPNQRLKLSARGGRLIGNGSVLSAAAAGRSLSANR